MDPIHLRPSELDYELRIRNVVGLSNIRTGTKTLREILKKEALGIEVNPADSSAAFAFGNELIECSRIVKTINETIDSAKDNYGSILWSEAEHRIIHLKGRLKRIHVEEIQDLNRLHGLRVDCDNLVRRIADGGRLSIENRISFNIPSARPTVESGVAARATQPVTARSEVPNRLGGSMGEQEVFLGFSQEALDPMPRSTGFVTGGRGRGKGTTPADVQRASIGVMSNRHNRIPTPSLFADRLQIPTSQSLLGLDAAGAAGVDCHSVGNGIGWESELRELTRRETQTARANVRDENILNESLSAMNLGSGVPTYNRDVPIQRTNEQPTIYRDLSVRHSDLNIYADAEERSSVSLPNNPNEPTEPRDKVRNLRENFVNSDFAPNLGETYVHPRRDAEFCSLNTAVGSHLRTSVLNHLTNAQPSIYREPARGFSDPDVYAAAGDESRKLRHCLSGPSAPPQQEGIRYRREDGPPPSAFANNNYSGTAFQPHRRDYGPPPSAFANNNYAAGQFGSYRREDGPPPSVYVNNNSAPNRVESYHQLPRQSFEPQHDFRQPHFRNAHKSVPVNHWKISFSGDGQGLHLFDFLSQVKMLQRSEMVPDRELLPMMVHLFTGRAKNWYGRWSGTFQTWEELVEGLRTEFLPENYRFIMLEKITNRKQKASESIGEFLALMQSQFMWLDIPIDDQHQVFIVRNNLLPKFAQGVAPFEIRTLGELARVCRRVESATQSVGMSLPFESQNYSRNPFQRAKAMNEVEYEDEQTSCGGDLCVVGRTGPIKCYNCQKDGHIFRSCTRPKEGVFCYSCGGKNVTTKTCSKCAGNGVRGLTARASQEASPEAQTAAQQGALPRQSSA